ncbi:hypothetical protein EJB05_08072, partial [Eragrostis curvula]
MYSGLTPAWHFDNRGLFTVKSAYRVTVEKQRRERSRATASAVHEDMHDPGCSLLKFRGDALEANLESADPK